jgi:hypothetical protein
MWHFDERGISRERQANEKETLSGRRELSVDPVVRGSAAESASSTQASSPSTTPGAAQTVTCDFSNPGYSGWCRVTKQLQAGRRSRGFCAQVLSCLNDVRCIKTYCNATTIRTGWKLGERG